MISEYLISTIVLVVLAVIGLIYCCYKAFFDKLGWTTPCKRVKRIVLRDGTVYLLVKARERPADLNYVLGYLHGCGLLVGGITDLFVLRRKENVEQLSKKCRIVGVTKARFGRSVDILIKDGEFSYITSMPPESDYADYFFLTKAVVTNKDKEKDQRTDREPILQS